MGKFLGLQIFIPPSAIVSIGVLSLALGGISIVLIDFSFPQAILFGGVCAGIHFSQELLHQYGHSLAARRVGYPMTGVRFWFLLATSLYPTDEPELPATIHIQRALGGPFFSFFVTLLEILLLLILPSESVLWWVAAFAAFDNLSVFSLGAFLPLGFTDGSTLLYWMKRR